MRTVLVTGGTGTLGRLVVSRLAAAGTPVRVLSRKEHQSRDGVRYVVGDLEQRAPSLDGVDVIVHCASAPRTKGGEVITTGMLVHAALARDDRPTLVYISIVGVDRVPLPYYREKLAAEDLIERSELPFTILRTTQFHDLIATIARSAARSPVTPVLAGTSFQPIDAGEVADRLVDLAGQPARGRVEDMGGPAVRTHADLVRAYLRAVGKKRVLLPVHVPGATGRGYRAGGHLAPDHAVGRLGFEEFLARGA